MLVESSKRFRRLIVDSVGADVVTTWVHFSQNPAISIIEDLRSHISRYDLFEIFKRPCRTEITDAKGEPCRTLFLIRTVIDY